MQAVDFMSYGKSLCTAYKQAPAGINFNTSYPFSYWQASNGTYIYVYDSNLAGLSGSALRAALAGVKVVFIPPVLNPISVDPQPTIIPPSGDCVAWTDCGSTIDIVYTKQP